MRVLRQAVYYAGGAFIVTGLVVIGGAWFWWPLEGRTWRDAAADGLARLGVRIGSSH